MKRDTFDKQNEKDIFSGRNERLNNAMIVGSNSSPQKESEIRPGIANNRGP